MKIGMLLRNSGPVSTPSFIADCARAGDESELDSLWVLDHVAIPPDDAEGSGGRYVDALATLAYVAGITARIKIGTSVLVLPYRPPLATANWIAAIQELSAGRLMLGVGAGWMETEFVVSDADRGSRGRVTDETLAFLSGFERLRRVRLYSHNIQISSEALQAFREGRNLEPGSQIGRAHV